MHQKELIFSAEKFLYQEERRSIHANSRISIKGDTHITIQDGGELYTYGAEPNSSDISVSGDADIIIGAGGLITSNGSLNISENAKINATSMADVMDILDTTIEAKNINITGGEISLLSLPL